MLKDILKRVVGAAGYQLVPAGQLLNAEANYPISPKPRWGQQCPPHPQLQRVLEGERSLYEETLKQLKVCTPVMWEIKHDLDEYNPSAPFWDNDFFQSFDAASLMGFLLSRNPKRYMEIGSGNSTCFARHAIRSGKLRTTITSLDPSPRAEIDALCDHVRRVPLEECDVSVFDELEAGDILFFDGSHRVFQNSDVVVFFLEIIPRLKPGVLVHIHDIFLPSDYPLSWRNFLFSEQYMLAAMLLCREAPIRPVLPNYFVCKDDELRKLALDLFKKKDGSFMDAALFRGASELTGSSFWSEIR